MKIVILDGFTANPGDLSWERLAALGDVAVGNVCAFLGGTPQNVISA